MAEPTLKLTGIIFPGDSPGVYVGCLKEIRGIVAQGDSVDAVYRDLVDGARYLVEHRRGEALELLRQQVETDYATDSQIEIDVERELAPAPEVG